MFFKLKSIDIGFFKRCNNRNVQNTVKKAIKTHEKKLRINPAKFLLKLLGPVIPNEHCTKDPYTFCKEIQGVSANDYFLVSNDVCSLFTSIPVNEPIEIAVELIFQNEPNLKISRNELKELFKFATSVIYFLIKDDFYDHVDDFSMNLHWVLPFQTCPLVIMKENDFKNLLYMKYFYTDVM